MTCDVPDSITFRPTDEQGRFINGLVDSGDFASQSEVIRAGLRLLQEEQAGSRLQALREALMEGEQSGDDGVLDMEAVRAEAKRAAGIL